MSEDGAGHVFWSASARTEQPSAAFEFVYAVARGCKKLRINDLRPLTSLAACLAT
jgi:hypothetical protein